MAEAQRHTGNGGPATNGNPRGKSVQDYYGKQLKTAKDLKTSACTAAGRPSPAIRAIMQQIPEEIISKFYGCGAPLPQGIDGLRVLDLGSGSGRDAYVCAALGAAQVTGIDFTEEQLEVARRHAPGFCSAQGLAKDSLRFVQGDIQDLQAAGLQDASFDLIISNCVVNLAHDKGAVLREAFRVLADGGEFYFSDVYCDRRLSQEVQKHEVLWGECIAGALYDEDFKRLAAAAGFADVRTLSSAPVAVEDPELLAVVGAARFSSITYRLFKLPGLLESRCEDYGQVATYKGTIPGHPAEFALDSDHVFQAGKPALVCGNTAAMCGEQGHSWLAKHFQVQGNRDTHYGLFQGCAPAPAAAAAPAAAKKSCCA